MLLEDYKKDLRIRFTYHTPKEGQPELYETIRNTAHTLALYIIGNTPGCREQALAITKLEEAVMWANAAIARRS